MGFFFYVKKKTALAFDVACQIWLQEKLVKFRGFFFQKIMFSLFTYFVNNKSNDVLCLLLLLLTYKNLVKSDKYRAPCIGTILFLRTK